MLRLCQHSATRPPFAGPRACPASSISRRGRLQVTCEATKNCSISCTRRKALLLSSALALSIPGLAKAEEVAAEPLVQSTASTEAPAPSASPPPVQVKYEDVDFELSVPESYKELDLTPQKEDKPGPAPAASALRARFDSPDGQATISVVVKGAQTIKPSFLQVTDITMFGSLQEAAKLLLPRGSTVLKAQQLQEAVPPKTTPLGTVDLPPKSYYIYEFVTPNGLHVTLTAAAQRGKVYVCGGSAKDKSWAQANEQLLSAVSSFRLRDGVSIY